MRNKACVAEAVHGSPPF